MASIFLFIVELFICAVIGVICLIVGTFVGHIDIFEGIALGIVGWLLAKNLLPIHSAFALIIGVAILVGILAVFRTRYGFWIIGGVMSVMWGFIAALFSYDSTRGTMWTYAVWAIGAVVVFILHNIAKENSI